MSELKCCVDDCNKHTKKGCKYCSMHYARLTRTGRLDKKSPFERMIDRTIKNTETGCIVYRGYLNSGGYGRLRSFGKKVIASRLCYEHFFGNIPENKMVLHKCDNPACVNPDHLFLGDYKDNAVDMASKNRQWLQRAKEQGLKFDMCNGRFPNGYKSIR